MKKIVNAYSNYLKKSDYAENTIKSYTTKFELLIEKTIRKNSLQYMYNEEFNLCHLQLLKKTITNYKNSGRKLMLSFIDEINTVNFFNKEDLESYNSYIDKDYTKDSEGKDIYNSIRNKLDLLAMSISKEITIPFYINYKERPDQQNGQGRLAIHKPYILVGFIPERHREILGKDVFIKYSFWGFGSKIKFGVDLDVNFSDKENKYKHLRDQFQSKNTVFDLENDFPNNWSELIEKIAPITQIFVNKIEGFVKQKKQIELRSINQILYGPPGTGKTYQTINKAVAIANPEFVNDDSEGGRIALKQEYDRLVKAKQIVFTTFHQSMAYEDFVEGIKPDTTEKDEVIYNVEGGLFMKSCARAAYNKYKILKKNSKPTKYSFDQLYTAFVENERKAIVNNKYNVYSSLTGTKTEIYKINSRDSIKARAEGSKSTHVAPLTKENVQKLYDTFLSIEEITNLTQIKECVGISPRKTEFYAVFKGLKQFETTFEAIDDEIDLDDVTDKEILSQFLSGVYNKALKNNETGDAVVLIIDEINRGNVSAIFGELITLIEESKRLGNSEALEVTLPYSKEKFGVPNNLHIIGTMNTADRSVEALDTALRRRFVFEEIMPNPELLQDKQIENIELKEVLTVINQRIEALVDRDHTIGHSYFINISNEEDLANTFNNNIVPLLQEYFYGDYGKIGLVLGKGFVKLLEKTNVIFAGFTYDDKDQFENNLYILQKVSKDNVLAAINMLLNKDQ